MNNVVILIVILILLLAAAPLLRQRGVDQLQQEVVEEVRKDSSEVDYNLVCTGVYGAEAEKLARQNGRCE